MFPTPNNREKLTLFLFFLFFLMLFLGSVVFGAGFQQLDHSTKTNATSTAFGQDLGFGNDETIDYVKLYLEPVEGLGEDFKVQIWSDVVVDEWSENVPIGELGVKALYTFNFPNDVVLISGEEFGFAVDNTQNKKFYIYGSDNTESWPNGEAWNDDLGDLVDLYFDFGLTPPPPTFFSFDADDLASTTAYISDIFSSARGLFFLAGGIHLAFYFIKRLIRIMPM